MLPFWSMLNLLVYSSHILIDQREHRVVDFKENHEMEVQEFGGMFDDKYIDDENKWICNVYKDVVVVDCFAVKICAPVRYAYLILYNLKV